MNKIHPIIDQTQQTFLKLYQSINKEWMPVIWHSRGQSNITIIFLDSDFKKLYIFYILKVEAKYGQIRAYSRLHTIINNYVINVIDSSKNYA